MYFPKLRSYKRVLAVVVGFGILGVIFSKRGIADKFKVFTYLDSTHAEESFLPHIEFRRTLASKLLKAAEDVRWGRHASAISEIRAAAAVLDNRYYFSSTPQSSAQPGWIPVPLPKKETSKTVEKDSAAVNPLFVDPPLDLNLTTSQSGGNTLLPNIDVESISNPDSSGNLGSIVTILIDDCRDVPNESRKTKMSRVVSQIREHWPYVKIVIGVNRGNLSELDKVQNGNDVIAIDVECDRWNFAPVEPFLPYVASPYVLFLESTSAVTSDLNITRLLRVSAGMRGVGVVGIAERGVDGGWDYTCSQLQHRNAHLSITDGYEYSQAACLFCDVTSSSFLAATNVLQTVQPDSSLPVPVRQIDWALRLHGIHVMTVTCPDVMIHTTNRVVQTEDTVFDTDHPCTTKEEKRQARDQHLVLKRLYRKLAQRYELNSISFQNKTFLEYTCLEIHYECKARSKVREFLLPPCCLKLKNKLIKNYNVFTKDTLIPYKLEAGTILGAVKFKNPLPWDFDDDVHYENADVDIFKNNKERLIQMGLPPSFNVHKSNGAKHNYVYIHGKGDFTFDSWGVEELSAELSKIDNKSYSGNIPCLQYGHYPTLIEQFLEDSSSITNHVKKLRREENEDRNRKMALVPPNNKIARGLLQPKKYPPIPKARCYLYSFVRLGDNWFPAPFNPGLHVLKKFGDGLFKHQPHWRFLPNSKYVWPPCSFPGHPLCLNIHPSDGSIPFF